MTKEEKFMDLLKPVYKNLEKYAISISKNRNDAKDIISDTLFHSFKNFEKLKNPKGFLSFLFTIASRVKIQIYRKNSRFDVLPIEDFYNYASNEINPETYTEINLLRNAIDKLNEKDKEILLMKEISGLTIKEISSALSISTPNVKIRLHRARKLLEKLLN